MSEKNLSRRSFLKALSAFGAAAATTAVGIPALAEESTAIFTPGTYVGAFNATDNWTAGWANFDPQNAAY